MHHIRALTVVTLRRNLVAYDLYYVGCSHHVSTHIRLGTWECAVVSYKKWKNINLAKKAE
ncbi:hypothetical protein YC2023_053501 [Brassica napus]